MAAPAKNSSPEEEKVTEATDEEQPMSRSPLHDLVHLGTFCSFDVLFCGMIYFWGFHVSLTIPFIGDLDPTLKSTIYQLWLMSFIRAGSLMYLGVYKDGEFIISWRTYFRISVFFGASFMYIHQVVRLLLDSEAKVDQTFILYVILSIWSAFATGVYSYIGYKVFLQPLAGESGDEDSDEDEDESIAKDFPIWATLLKVFSWYKRYSLLIIVVHGLLFFEAAVQSFEPHFKAKVIDIISSDEPAGNLSHHAVMLSVVTMLGSVVTAARSGLFTYIKTHMQGYIQTQLFRVIIHKEMAFFDSTKSGEITSALTDNAESLCAFLDEVYWIVSGFVRLVCMIAFMWTLSWQLTLVVVLGNAILICATAVYGQTIRKTSMDLTTIRCQASDIIQEAIANIRVVRSHGNEETEVKNYADKLKKSAFLQLKDSILWPIEYTIQQFLEVGMLVSIVAYGGHLAVNGRITSGDLVSFILYMSSSGNEMSCLIQAYKNTMRELGSCDKVFKYLEHVKEKSGFTGKMRPETIHGRVEFKDVNFTYPSRPDNQVLKNLSFEVKPGEVVALVGPSGAGKSTCFSLLKKFYQPDSGCVTLDQQLLTEYDHYYFHQKVAMVAQEPVLFGRSIKSNIHYALEDVSQERIEEAAGSANAHGFITELEDGYETEAGERGTQLSGGQKQRIAIARSIIRNPTVILLDEATSALDAESEQQVQDAVFRNLTGKTVLIIAHRLSTVVKADRIFVIKDGSLVEQGSHSQLLHKRGLYYKMVSKQLFKDRQISEIKISFDENEKPDENERPENTTSGNEVEECNIEDKTFT